MANYFGETSFFDICQAHLQLEADYNSGGILRERPSNARRNESTDCQLHRLHFSPGTRWVDICAADDEDGEDDTVRDIYLTNVLKWDLPIDAEMMRVIKARYTAEWLAQFPQTAGDKRTGYADLSTFEKAYVEAMFFTECNSDNEELEHATTDDISAPMLSIVRSDCAEFLAVAEPLLEQAYALDDPTYDEERAAHDLWYTRNGHGVGFWDRGLGEIGDKLTELCGRKTRDLYKGDDGKLYLS